MDGSVARLYPDWPQYNGRLVDAVRDRTAVELELRAGPDHGTIWMLAAHVAGARVYWLCGILGQPGADRTPFPDPFADGWEDDPAHPRSGQELGLALDATFEVVRECLDRWTPDDLALTAERTYQGVTVVHSRASVLNRLLTHDAFHAGEISQLLGRNDLPPIDLWRRPRP
jgi:uncharacterized damage-inducible protein DinB